MAREQEYGKVELEKQRQKLSRVIKKEAVMGIESGGYGKQEKLHKKPTGDFFDVEDSTGVYRVYKPDLGINPVQVYCDCSDFIYTFDYANAGGGALLGGWEKSRYKTNGNPKQIRYKSKALRSLSKRKNLNPNRHIGVCKHIVHLVKVLRQMGFING